MQPAPPWHPVPGCADMQALIGIWPVLDTAAVLRGEGLPLERVRLLRPHPPPGAGRDLPGHQLF